MIWIKRVSLTLLAIVVWLVSTLLFISKERACNALVAEAAKQQITLCYKRRDTTFLGCDFSGIKLRYAGSAVAKVATLHLYPWRIEAKKIEILGMAADALPPRIEKILFDPLAGKLRARGDFGTLVGEISYLHRNVHFELTPSALMRRKFFQTLRIFRLKDGKYLYETAF